MPRIQLAALTLAATIIAAAGCGGSSKTSSTATTPAASTSTPSTTPVATHPTDKSLTRTQLIAKGDEICAKANAKTSVLVAKNVQDFKRIFPQVALYNRTEASEMSALAPPSALAQDWARMIEDLEQHSRYLDEVAHDVSINDEHAAARPYKLGTSALENLIETGKRDGFARCSHLS